MKVTCEHIEAIVREAVGKLEAIRNAPEGAAPSQDDALAQMTKERDEWSHKANEWRRKYAELCYPGMTTEVHAASGLPGQDGPLIQELSKAKAVIPVAAPPDDGEGEYVLTFYFRNWNDLTDAHVAWMARGDVAAPDEMDINAFNDLQEDLRNAYRAAEKHTQRALLLRVLKWMGDGPTALQLNESGIEEWLPKSDYDTLFQRYADVCAELAICKGPPAAAPVALGGEPPCNPHPDAPHGYNRNASHNAGRYVCDCEGWAALGGEKGEADLVSALAACRDAFPVPPPGHPAENDWAAAIGDPESVPHFVRAMLAAPVGKARMLTEAEADHITGMHNTGRAQGDSECAEAIQRKFCEVNGITLEGGNRSGG